MEQINKYIDIEFCYNGELGQLQQRTADNLRFIDMLYRNNQINHEEWRAGREVICGYFEQEIKKVLECPISYIE